MAEFVQKISNLGLVPMVAIVGLLGGSLSLPSSTSNQQGNLAPFESGSHQPVEDQRFGYLESFSHLEAMQKGGNSLFAHRIETRLPKYQSLMQDAASLNALDWHLLAAMSYQESFWNPDATSPTGVRGLMMLTLETAKELKVNDRLDPQESIHGGARYFAQLRERLPERIQEPDRTWMALAAYNTGMSHLQDARILTKHLGKDPDRWSEVKEHLPLLEQKQYYQFLRHGYARGREAVAYVERIRQYRTILTWHSNIEQNGLAITKNNERFKDATVLVPREAILPLTPL